ncbi:MAG: nuclear transport factor 2 family protein [Acidimicrobiia bacterium]|nr:nuclear transport factor 2 family protein [Acidimicrobiia bacterium]
MDLELALELERRVWRALCTGDRDLDQAMLSEDFLGVYPTGISDRAGHVDQLADGPTVRDFRLSEARLIQLTADEHVLLCYRADWRPPRSPGETEPGPVEAMYISSIWSWRADGWINTFSQDTPTEPRPDVFDL